MKDADHAGEKLGGRQGYNSTMTGHAACIFYVVKAIKEKEWRMSIPCCGDLSRTCCDNYSMLFLAPAEASDDLLAGLKAIRKASWGLPSSPSFAIQYPFGKDYVEIGQSIGMDWVR